MGINVFCPLYPVETTISQIKLVDENCDLCTLASTALKYRDDLNAARYNVKAAEARKNAALARFSPTISLNAQRADAGSVQQGVNSNQAIQLVATWTADGLFAEQYTLYRSLKALQKESEYQAVTLARNIKQSLVNSYYESKTSNERVKAAFEEVVASNESVRLANLRMQAGVGVFLDVLQAQATATESKVRYINAIIDYNIAQAQLLFDSGIISVNNLLCGKVIRTTNLDEIAVEDSNATGVIPQLPVKTP